MAQQNRSQSHRLLFFIRFEPESEPSPASVPDHRGYDARAVFASDQFSFVAQDLIGDRVAGRGDLHPDADRIYDTRISTAGETEVCALDGVSMSVDRGEFVSVVGTSGSGKSMLLYLLGGLDLPTDGKMYINGTDLYSLAPDPLTVFRRRCIGFVFQRYNLLFLDLTLKLFLRQQTGEVFQHKNPVIVVQN